MLCYYRASILAFAADEEESLAVLMGGVVDSSEVSVAVGLDSVLLPCCHEVDVDTYKDDT